MRASSTLRLLAGIAFIAAAASPAVHAQSNPAHAHIGHAADGFRGTPDGMGLLPTAAAEIETAVSHAGYAAGDPNNLGSIQRHMPHVIHALDPSVVENGPGAGYGVKAAASGAARHIELAAAAEGASDNVKTHATHVATAASNAVTWTDEAVALAQEIQDASDAETATELLHELIQTLEAIQNGTDANGDGRTGWQEGEGGLAQAQQHLNLLKRGEGMG